MSSFRAAESVSVAPESEPASLFSSPLSAKAQRKRAAQDTPNATNTPDSSYRPRSSARRSLKQRHATDTLTPGAEEEAPAPPPESTLASPESSTSPERKIWMRPCNCCGLELHVRRVRCTSCGAVQMSKRAYAAQQEERVKAEERGEEYKEPEEEEEEVVPVKTSLRRAAAVEEAQQAASSLAQLIADAPDAAAAAKLTAAHQQPTYAFAAAAVKIASPAPTVSKASLVSALARLNPERLAKLRRMQKLRALLSNLPPGVTLPSRTTAAAPADRQTGGQQPAASAATAAPGSAEQLAAAELLASVACM